MSTSFFSVQLQIDFSQSYAENKRKAFFEILGAYIYFYFLGVK